MRIPTTPFVGRRAQSIAWAPGFESIVCGLGTKLPCFSIPEKINNRYNREHAKRKQIVEGKEIDKEACRYASLGRNMTTGGRGGTPDGNPCGSSSGTFTSALAGARTGDINNADHAHLTLKEPTVCSLPGQPTIFFIVTFQGGTGGRGSSVPFCDCRSPKASIPIHDSNFDRDSAGFIRRMPTHLRDKDMRQKNLEKVLLRDICLMIERIPKCQWAKRSGLIRSRRQRNRYAASAVCADFYRETASRGPS